MKHDQYLKDMHDAVDAAAISAVAEEQAQVTLDKSRLHKSINAAGDPERMKDDTIFRTNGRCGASAPERINGIAESFHRLNGGRDGG